MVTVEKYIGAYAPDQAALVADLEKRKPELLAQLVLLKIPMPCGWQKTYQLLSDIPDHSVPCPCGDPSHWIIKYATS